MTFPVVATTATTTLTSVTSLVVNMPASVAVGDLLEMEINLNGTYSSRTLPSGWISQINDTNGTIVAYKYADGTEGSTQTVTISPASRTGGAVVRRITGGDGVTAPFVASTPITTNTTTFDPPNAAPGWGSLDILWLADLLYFTSAGNMATVSTAPTGYSLDTHINDGTSTQAGVVAYHKNSTASSEDPSAATLSAGSKGYALTIGIKPNTAAVAAVSASASVAGVGAATTNAVGAISASSAVAGVGKATTNAVGSIAASGADTGVGASTAAGVGLIAATGAFFAVAASPRGIISVTASVIGVGASIAAAVGAIAASSGGAGTGVGLAQAIGMVSANAYVASVGAATFSGVGQISAVSVLVPAVFMEYADTERAWVTWQSNKLRLEYENRSFRVSKRTDIQERSNLRTIHVIPRLRK